MIPPGEKNEKLFDAWIPGKGLHPEKFHKKYEKLGGEMKWRDL